MNFVVRTRSLPSGMIPSIRRALDGVDPELALADTRTLESILGGASAQMAGAAAGLAAAAAGGRVIESVLYGVGPRDPRVFIATTVLLLGVGLLACWIPARRASRLSPVEALRQE